VYFLDCSRIFLTNLVTVKVFMTFITECSSILKKKNVAFQKRFTYFEQKSCNVLKKSCACVYKEKYDFWKKKWTFLFRGTVHKGTVHIQYCLPWLLFQRALLFVVITVYRTYCSYGCCSSARTVHLGTRVAVGESPGHKGRAPWWLAA
jgi:hypothetical protein